MEAKFLDLNKPWSCKYRKKKIEKIHMYDFAVHECTQEQNGSPYFSPIVRQIDRHAISWPLCQELSQERLLRSRNFAIMANTT